METLGDLVARDREVSGTALRAGGREYGYRRFATTAMKAGNFLRLHGVARGGRVGIAAVPAPEPLLAFFGAALLGARARIDPPPGADAAALVAPTGRLAGYEPPPGCTRIGFGDEPSDPAVEHFERGVWSENPAFPPTDVEGRTEVLEADGGAYTHADLLDAAERVADEHGIGAGDTVALRASLAEPGGLAAGVVTPLRAGATAVLGGGEGADHVVADGAGGSIDAGAVLV